MRFLKKLARIAKAVAERVGRDQVISLAFALVIAIVKHLVRVS